MDDNFEFLTPEMAQRLAAASFAPDDQERLDKQIQQAIALRNGAQPTYATPGAAALGGAAHLIDVLNSNHKEGALRDQQAQLSASQKGTSAEWLRAMQQLQNMEEERKRARVGALRAQQMGAAPPQDAPAAPAAPQGDGGGGGLGSLLTEYGG